MRSKLVCVAAAWAVLIAVGRAEGRVIAGPPGSSPTGAFGRAVAGLGGGAVAVGAPNSDVEGLEGAGAVYLVAAGDSPGSPIAHPPTRPRGVAEHFGAAVVAVGTRLVVGAPGASVDGLTGAGAAYLLEANGTFVAELVPPARGPGDTFGVSLAALDSQILIGAPGTPVNGLAGAGVIHLFDAQGQYLRTFDLGASARAGDMLGYAVAAVGSNVLAGAPRPELAASGAAYLFAADTRALLKTFESPSASPADLFGAAVAAAGGNVAIGAPFDDAVASDAGSVYLFAGGDPQMGMLVSAPKPESGALFGAALAADVSEVIVGAPFTNAGAPNAGAAYRVSVTTGTVTSSLLDPAPVASALFGSSVAIRDGSVVIGAPGAVRVDVPVCGDSVQDAGEECDWSADAACPNACSRQTCTCGALAVCGDGVVSGREACDDGNLAPCDGCSPSCEVEFGFVCGDGFRDPSCGEQCDDGNTTSGDGCSATCRFECASDTDCRARFNPNTSCVLDATCVAGECSFVFADRGTQCTSSPCSMCDGFGMCQDCQNVGCRTDADCEDGDPCTINRCLGDVVKYCSSGPVPAGDPCLDDNLCDSDACDASGMCIKNPQPRSCDDGNACTADFCVPASGCQHLVLGGQQERVGSSSCDDGDACTLDSCDAASGCRHVRIPNCCQTDGDCTNECRTGGTCKLCNYCPVLPYGLSCCQRAPELRPQCEGGALQPMSSDCSADNNACTMDYCLSGACVVGPLKSCDDGNPCTRNVCDPTTGCANPPVPADPPVDCGDLCQGEHCDAGQCVKGTPPCPPGDLCDPAGPVLCVPFHMGCSNTTDCADTNVCTTNERCAAGMCAYDPVTCPPTGDDCLLDPCRPDGGCDAPLIRKSDGTPCHPKANDDPCAESTAMCHEGTCVPDRMCEISVSQPIAPQDTRPCVRRRVVLDVECVAIGDNGGTRKQRQRAYCRAEGNLSGKPLATPVRRKLDPAGRAAFQIALNRRGRRELCAQGSLDMDVTVTLHDRRGRVTTTVRSVAVAPVPGPHS